MPMIDAHIPEGALAPAAEATLLRELTDILIRWEGFDPANERARAEGAPVEAVEPRVWVFPLEVPDGRWGGRGAVRRLPDMLAMLEGEHARDSGRARLRERRRRDAIGILRDAVEG